jgi:hypothetical protein
MHAILNELLFNEKTDGARIAPIIKEIGMPSNNPSSSVTKKSNPALAIGFFKP